MSVEETIDVLLDLSADLVEAVAGNRENTPAVCEIRRRIDAIDKAIGVLNAACVLRETLLTAGNFSSIL